MALPQRHLIPLACFLAVAFAWPAHAAATFRAFVINRGDQVEKLFYDTKDKQIVLSANSLGFSPSYPAPTDGTVSFYRLEAGASPDAPPKKIPVTSVRLGSDGEWIVFFFLKPGADKQQEIQTMAVDASWESHPVETVRIFNFSKTPVALNIAGRVLEIPQGRSDRMDYPEGPQQLLWTKVAARNEAGAWTLLANAPMTITQGTRSTWVVLDIKIGEDEQQDRRRVVVRNLIDPVPAQQLSVSGRPTTKTVTDSSTHTKRPAS